MSVVTENQKGRASSVKKFADEVYQQCVDKGWTIGDFRLFTQFLELRKESAFSEVRQQVNDTSLPNSC